MLITRLFVCPSKMGRIMGSPVASRRAASSSLSGAYLQNYTSYGYEILWVVTTWVKTGVSCDNLPLLFLFSKVLLSYQRHFLQFEPHLIFLLQMLKLRITSIILPYFNKLLHRNMMYCLCPYIDRSGAYSF